MSTIPLNDPVLGQAPARGRFITLEGGEGAGKSTQVQRIIAHLKAKGLDAIATREPGGSPGAEAMREVLLSGKIKPLGPGAEALAFYAARLDHIEKTIRPALERGQWVICDRFVDSSRAYQGGAGGLSDADVLALHRVGSQGLLPDLTLLIEVPPEVAAARTAARDGDAPDRIGGRDADYHARVAASFARLAEDEPERFARIDGDGPAELVHDRIMAALSRFGVAP